MMSPRQPRSVILLIILYCHQQLCQNVDDDEPNCATLVSCPTFRDSQNINKWSEPSQCIDASTNFPRARSDHASAVYTRGPLNDSNADNNQRMVMFGGGVYGQNASDLVTFGDTWLYYPSINSWFAPEYDIHPSNRVDHTMTTLCDTKVILFGGVDTNNTVMNDTWLFNGVTETWKELQPSVRSIGITPRHFHSAVALYQPDSHCKCNRSLIVYGGRRNATGDLKYAQVADYRQLWELRCVDDSDNRDVYEWIVHERRGDGPSSRLEPSVVSFGDSTMYFWGGVRENLFKPSDVWRYELVSNNWTLITAYTFTKSSTGKITEGTVGGAQIAVPFWFKNRRVGLTTTVQSPNKQYFLDVDTGEQIVSSSFRNSTTQVVASYYLYSSVLIGRVVLVYGGYSATFGYNDRVWNLTITSDQWNFVPNPYPQKTPRARVLLPSNAVVVGDSIYLFGGLFYLTYYSELVPHDVWTFSMKSRAWYRSWVSFNPPSRMLAALGVVNDSVVVVFGGTVTDSYDDLINSSLVKSASNETWAYYTNSRRWVRLESGLYPTGRVASNFVSMPNDSLLMYGGNIPGQLPSNELWRFDLCDHYFSATMQRCDGWTRLGPNGDANEIWPSSGQYYATSKLDNSLIMFKFMKDQNNLEIWKFNMTNGKWMKRKIESVPISLLTPGFIYSTSYQRKLLVVKQNVSIPSWIQGETPLGGGVVLSYSDINPQWLTHSEGPSVGVGAMVAYRNKVIVVGLRNDNSHNTATNKLFVSVMTPRCSAGYFTKDWFANDCVICPAGEYAESGSLQCSRCPAGRTTFTTPATSVDDCQCDDTYCLNGKCHVVLNSSQSAMCQCTFGYAGTRCQINHLQFIVLGVCIAFFIVAIITALLIRKCISYKRGQVKAEEKLYEAEEELTSLRKAWSIASEEITLNESIGAGSFGTVSTAYYRDMIVVVKKLREDLILLVGEEEDFAKEVEFMQSIRHPNIVLFFGAGKDADNTPFLILEHAPRGSLRDVLNDTSIVVDKTRRVSFAFDTAKGMKFLHGLRPKRIHRDLKSSNLLVSQGWTVKIADFGTARVISTKRKIANFFSSKKRSSVRRRSTLKDDDCVELQNKRKEDLTEPLLTSNVGTVLWQAPETIGHNTRYGQPSDVYRLEYKSKRACSVLTCIIYRIMSNSLL